MAYSADGKVRTSHALMDNIVHEVKKILKGIVLKNDMLAAAKETAKSVNDWEIYQMLQSGSLSFDNFPFDEEYLSAFGYTPPMLASYLEDRYIIPEEDRQNLLEFCTEYYLTTFEEKNDYYRSLLGLPPYNTDTEYWITYDGTYDKIGYKDVIPSYYLNADHFEIDTSLPLHKQTNELINIIQSNNGIEKLREVYQGSGYAYIQFLANKKIDWELMRRSGKYDILYMPHVEQLVEDRFQELYVLNRAIYLRKTYQEAYIYESDYYEQIMMIMILCQTFADIIAEIPEWYIRRDIFDLRTVQYFLESYSVDFFPEIPLKYQIRIVKNLNTLIKYKSSNRNNYDIINIFDLKDTKIYKYYLYKRQRKDGENYIHSTPNDKNYELQFIRSEISDTYDNYIKNNLYIEKYDSITLEDKYWDGELDHETLRKQILSKDFTIEGTKYMSIEYIAPQGDYIDQMQFFVGTVLASNFDMDDFTITVPSISDDAQLRVSDLFLFLMVLSDIYEGTEQILKLPDPEVLPWELPFDESYDRVEKEIDGGYAWSNNDDFDGEIECKTDYDMPTVWQVAADGGKLEYSRIKNLEEFNNWTKYWYDEKHGNIIHPGMYERREDWVYGFNDVDLDVLRDILSRNHSRWGFTRGYTLEELGVDRYISPCDANIDSAEELTAFYHNNMAIYRSLKERMAGKYFTYNEDGTLTINAKDYDEYKVLEFVFDTLFTRQFDYTFYTLVDGSYATKLSDILFERSYILYTVYQRLVGDKDKESVKSNIRDVINDIVDTLEFYLSGEGLEYIFSFAATSSFDALLRYIYLMINFFKSWKVHFIDPFVTYQVNDILQNSARVLDNIREQTDKYEKWDKAWIADTMSYTDFNNFTDSAAIKEQLGISQHFDPDPYDDYDYDGKGPEELEEECKEADGRYPDDWSQIPYIMLNGGDPGQGRFGWWDLDGAGPRDCEEEYLDIDGGYPYHEDDERTDWMGTLGFNYIVDGGYPSFSDVINRTMKLDLHNHEVYMEARISEKAFNVLKKDENGLYILDDWVEMDDFFQFVEDVASDFRIYRDIFEVIYALIEDLIDMGTVDQVIAEVKEKYIGDMEYVLENIEDDTAKDKITNYVNTMVDDMIETYSQFTALGTWGSIADS